MSLLRPESWQLAIAPADMAWAPLRGEVNIPVAHAAFADQADWASRLAPFVAAMRTLPARRRTLHVLLSNRLLQFAVLPWHERAESDADLQGMAQAIMAPLLGNEIDWQIALSPARYGKARLACAIPAGLHAALARAGAELQMSLQCVEPLVSPWTSRALPHRPLHELIVCAEGDEALALCVAQGELRWVRRLATPDSAEALQRELVRQQRLHGVPENIDTVFPLHWLQFGPALQLAGKPWVRTQHHQPVSGALSEAMLAWSRK